MKEYIVKEGETLKDIAKAQLGDPNLWIRLVWLNNLKYPYIVPLNQKQNYSNTVSPGDKIILSVEEDILETDNIEQQLFGVDIALYDGKLKLDNSVDGVDLFIKSGLENVEQAIRHRFLVRRTSVMYHQRYGTRVCDFVGKTTEFRNLQMLKVEAIKTIMQDPRVQSVKNIKVNLDQDHVEIYATVKLKSDILMPFNVKVGGSL